MKDFTAVLKKKDQLTEVVWRFGFNIVNDTLEFKPGQYVILKVNDVYRQYSICSSAHIHDYFELVVEIVPNGVASTYLIERNIEDTLNFKGPAGVFLLRDTNKHKIFLATGTGIAPVYSMLTTAFSSSQNEATNEEKLLVSHTLFFGLRYAKDVYLFDELKDIAENNPEVDFKVCLSKEESFDELDPKYYEKGRVNEVAKRFLEGKNASYYEFYLCGSAGVVDSLKEFAASLGAQGDCLCFEKFG